MFVVNVMFCQVEVSASGQVKPWLVIGPKRQRKKILMKDIIIIIIGVIATVIKASGVGYLVC
jgi:hypothetical protein